MEEGTRGNKLMMTINAEIIRISKKLPQNIQKLMDNPLKDSKVWSKEWDDWAKEVLYLLCLARDDGLISEDERRFLQREYFHNVGVMGTPEDDRFFRFFIGL